MPSDIVPGHGPRPRYVSYTADGKAWQRGARRGREARPGAGNALMTSGGQNRTPRLRPTQSPSPRRPLYSAPANNFQKRIWAMGRMSNSLRSPNQ